MDLNEELKLRPSEPDDLAFVHHSWGSSYYAGCKIQKHLSPQEFHAKHRPIRDRILSDPQKKLIICCGIEDHWTILGWMLYESHPTHHRLHYIYTKDLFKKKGIGRFMLNSILDEKPILYTHITCRGSERLAHHPEVFQYFTYCPHLV